MVNASQIISALCPLASFFGVEPTPTGAPIVHIKNGTLEGTYNLQYNQDLFLGIPFAEPPVNELRFARPQPLTTKWSSPRQAVEYGPFCYSNSIPLIGYHTNATYPQNEDCLTINIIRPHEDYDTQAQEGLPVLVWVYGGGFQEGGSGDPRYNMSRIVNISVDMGKPIIAVSFNYRMNAFGFVSGEPFVRDGNANLGLHDQRVALQWIQENIAAFGGDPKMVTLWGESAGALSIALHILANGGRDDGLFHRAILQSGSLFSAHNLPTSSNQREMLDGLLNRTGCSSANDTVTCLRRIPAPDLARAGAGTRWHPVIDNDLVSQLTSESIEKEEFIHVPLLIGTNTNEGSTFLKAYSRDTPVNTFDDVYRVIQADVTPFILPNETIAQCHQLYTDVMRNASESRMGTVLANPGPAHGQLHGELSVLLGDSMFTSGRRISCQALAKRSIPAYSFRFDTNPVGLSPEVYGSAHFQEVPFVFNSIDGIGYDVNPFEVENVALKQKYLDLAHLMSRMWLSFVQTGSPNNHGVHGQNIFWPPYSTSSPKNIVFNITSGVILESDNYRDKAMGFFWETAKIFNR